MNYLWISEAIFWIGLGLLMNDVVNARIPDGCKSRNLSITVDDQLINLFIDEQKITGLTNANNLRIPDTVDLPCNARVIAIEGHDTQVVGGITASTDDGYIISNTSWKCSNASIQGWQEVGFNDSSWKNAFNISKHGSFPNAPTNIIREDADRIWTQGYSGQDVTVFCRIKLDVDDCLFGQPINECDPSMGRCIRLPARGYNCFCYPGYQNDGQHKCKDVDECLLGLPENKCNASSGNCMNTPGSYKCRCYEGFANVGDERCEDVDGCLLGSPEIKCNASSGNCINTPGSYKCRCYDGFANVGDQRSIIFVKEPSFMLFLAANQSEIAPKTGNISTNKSPPEETYTHLTPNALRSNQNDTYEKIMK